MKQLWHRIADILFSESRKKYTALWVAGWATRASAVIVGALLGMSATDTASIGMIIGQFVGAAVLLSAPALFDFMKDKKLTERAKHFENLSEKVVEALEVTKRDNVVNFKDDKSKELLDALLGPEGKALVDKIQKRLNT